MIELHRHARSIHHAGIYHRCFDVREMNADELRAEYQTIKAQSEVLAGSLLDIPRRVSILTSIYLDSGRNHAFSQIAAHGALWALSYFEAGGSLGRLVARRYFYSAKEKAYRLGILREFADSFRDVNRSVCIDTYTNYQFTKQHGKNPHASDIVDPGLLDALNRVHHARQKQISLTEIEKREVFEKSFHCEQEVTVAPGVVKAVASFDCRIMRALCLHPIVRFSYFPRLKYVVFRDFSNTDERIAKGMHAYEIAVRKGWDHVYAAMEYYGQMPRGFMEAPLKHFRGIKSEVVRAGRIAQGMSEET